MARVVIYGPNGQPANGRAVGFVPGEPRRPSEEPEPRADCIGWKSFEVDEESDSE